MMRLGGMAVAALGGANGLMLAYVLSVGGSFARNLGPAWARVKAQAAEDLAAQNLCAVATTVRWHSDNCAGVDARRATPFVVQVMDRLNDEVNWCWPLDCTGASEFAPLAALRLVLIAVTGVCLVVLSDRALKVLVWPVKTLRRRAQLRA